MKTQIGTDVRMVRAMFDGARIPYEYRPAAPGGASYLVVRTEATSIETVFAFDGENRLVSVNAYERS